MRCAWWLLLVATAAQADDVNLLTSTPATVAVSSTVANARILPEHLVDGKLATAWNSQTGELAGAWIAVRVPADARVKTIKLTAGFASKLGKQDLFTLNPRIKKVRVSQGGKIVVEKALDITNRGLQDIPVDLAGGDFEIRVLEVEPGAKKTWRETCVSELEVWGTTPKVVKGRPSVRIHSLDAAPTLTREQCIAAALPARAGHVITNVEDIPLSDAIVLCRVDHKAKGSTTTNVEIAAVKRVRREVIGSTSEAFTVEETEKDFAGVTGSVQVKVVQLTQAEKGVIVTADQGRYGPMMQESKIVSKLYRATAFEPVLEWQSTYDEGESSDNDICELADWTPGKAMPNLVVECAAEHEHWHDDNPADRGVDRKERKERYRWDGTTYVKK